LSVRPHVAAPQIREFVERAHEREHGRR
jgi:hypothetical protein